MDHRSSALLMGSCFSENMASYFESIKIPACSNPLGIAYNPLSIVRLLDRILKKQLFSGSDFFEHLGMFKSYELHSDANRSQKDFAVDEINQRLQQAYDALSKASHLFITFGTAWVYELKKNGIIVNNCHKIPAQEFSKRCLEVNEIVASKDLLRAITTFNPDIEIVLNISPIRHLKDGFEENSLSKAVLRLAIEKLVELPNVKYFPSYEMLIDDLRDYRFYEKDLLHPSELAIDYIWTELEKCLFSEVDRKRNEQVLKLNRSMKHRVMQDGSHEHESFLKNLNKKIEQLSDQYPELNFEKEKLEIKRRLSPK